MYKMGVTQQANISRIYILFILIIYNIFTSYKIIQTYPRLCFNQSILKIIYLFSYTSHFLQ